MPSHYYIDGYNVLHSAKPLRALARRDLERAREALLDRLAVFCLHRGKQVTLVFDGQGEHRAQSAPHGRPAPGLEVLYAPGHSAADHEIERRIYLSPRRLDVVVVTADRGVRDLCRGMGALVMDPEHFWAELEESAAMVGDQLARAQPPAPHHLEDRLDGGSLETLRTLRRKLR